MTANLLMAAGVEKGRERDRGRTSKVCKGRCGTLEQRERESSEASILIAPR